MAKGRPPVVSIVNHKGGVLKTTTTANLGAALCELGKRVLLVDLDMQENLSESLLGVAQTEAESQTLLDALLSKASLDRLIRGTDVDGLDIVPSSEDFVEADLSLVSMTAREKALAACLASTEALGGYDLVLMDCPPAMSLVTVNALAASDYFIVPCASEYLPMRGLQRLGQIIANRVQDVAPDLTLLGVVMTLYHRNERICLSADKMVRERLGDSVFDTRIRVNTKAKTAPSQRKTILQFENSNRGRGTQDYRALAREFVERVAHFKEGARPEPVSAVNA